MKTYEAMGGEHIGHACAAAARLATETGEPVEFTFNDVRVVAHPGVNPDALVIEWDAETDRRRVAYEASPRGKASRARQEEEQRKANAAAAEGVLSFETVDAVAWAERVKINDDPYGAAAIRYAARWANIMEKRMAEGATLADCAEKASHDADIEGITGFMYGAAAAELAVAWKHGEELRRWHNLKTQIRDEGVKANESGGVLNPALLSIEAKD